MNSALFTILLVVLVIDLIYTLVRASLMNSRLPFLVDLEERFPQPVKRALHLLEKPRLRTTLRTGMGLLHFLLGGLAWVWLLDWIHQSPLQPLSLVALLLAVFVVIVVELVLEGIILRSPERWTIRLIGLETFFELLLRPISWLLGILQGKPTAAQNPLETVTEDDLKNWVEDGQPAGSLEKGEREMIYSIFQFGETLCREVMVPRIDVLALDVSTPLPQAIQAMTHSGHSRVPVFDETIDNIVGVLYAKDILRVQPADQATALIKNIIRPPYFVPEAKKVDQLLQEMQAKGVHIAIVVDEYGGMAGLVTLEDIVEEIVGEIRDEYDQSEEAPIFQVSPDEFLLSGGLDLDNVNELLDSTLSREVADTLGGFIYSEIGRVPVGNEEVEIDGWVLKVEQVSGRRIRKVRARRKSAKAETEGKKDDIER